MREAIDFAVAHSINMRQFEKVFQKQGYILDLNLNHKYPTIRSVNSKRSTRMYHLDDEYLPQLIYEKVHSNPYQVQQKYFEYMEPNKYGTTIQQKQYKVYGLKKARKITGPRALYFHYCYLLGIYPKKKQHKPLSPEMRAEWRKIDRYSNQVQLVCRGKLNTEVEVKDFIDTTTEQIKKVNHLRNGIYNKLRRCTDEILAQNSDDSRNQIHRYICLTNLIPQLLEKVDTKQIAFLPAVELFFYSKVNKQSCLIVLS